MRSVILPNTQVIGRYGKDCGEYHDTQKNDRPCIFGFSCHEIDCGKSRFVLNFA